MFKRSHNFQQQDVSDPYGLSSVAQKVRQSVSQGYKTVSPTTQQYSYKNDYELQHQYNQSHSQFQFDRPSLPSHISQPPSLSFGSSTASSLADWEDKVYTAPITAFQQSNSKSKRRFDDDDDMDSDGDDFQKPQVSSNYGLSKPQHTISIQAENDVNYFKSKYGELSFNEEF